MNLYNESIYLAFGGFVTPRVRTPAELLKYFTPIALVVKLNLVNEDTAEFAFETLSVIPYVRCSEAQESEYLLRYFVNDPHEEALALDYGICPDLTEDSNWSVDGKLTQSPSIQAQILIFPCSLPNPGDCATPAELVELKLEIGMLNKGYDPHNKDNPVQNLPSFDDSIHLDPNLLKRKKFQMRKNEIWDDEEQFGDKTFKDSYLDVYKESMDFQTRSPSSTYCSPANLAIMNCNPYLKFEFMSSGRNQIITRTYAKLLETLGEIGGNREIIMLFGYLIYRWRNRKNLRKHLNEEILEAKDVKQLVKYFPNESNMKSQENSKTKVHPHSQRELLDSVKKENDELKSEVIEIKMLLNGYYKQKENGISLIRSLNKAEIMENIFFQAHHKKLLPLVSLETTRKRMVAERNGLKDSSSVFQYGIEHADSHMTFEQAYKELLEQKTVKDSVEEAIKIYMLANLPSNLTNAASEVEEASPQFRKTIHVSSKDKIIVSKVEKTSVKLGIAKRMPRKSTHFSRMSKKMRKSIIADSPEPVIVPISNQILIKPHTHKKSIKLLKKSNFKIKK